MCREFSSEGHGLCPPSPLFPAGITARSCCSFNFLAIRAERDNALVTKKSDWPTRHEGNVKTPSPHLCEIETPMVQNEGFL